MEKETEERLVGYIASRDRVSLEEAKDILAGLSIPDKIRLELEAQPRAPMFESEYDPYGR